MSILLQLIQFCLKMEIAEEEEETGGKGRQTQDEE